MRRSTSTALLLLLLLTRGAPTCMGAELTGLLAEPANAAAEDSAANQLDTEPGDSELFAPPLETQTATGALTGGLAAAQPDRTFANTPPIAIFPRLGCYPVPPTGPGYYSAWDYLTGEYRQKPPPFPWGRTSLKPFFPFYDTDFRYLDDPKNTYFMWSDFMKRRRIGEDWLFSTGGEFRDRYMNEIDSRLTQTVNRYEQLRTMAYGSLYHRDDFGVFVQYLDAQHLGEELPPLPIDRDRSDLVDLFVDVKMLEWKDQPVYVRGGRQEVSLGSQRLVSNLEWANTLRTFQGVRAFRKGEKWDVTAFWLQPIIPNPTYFDSPDERQNLSGAWATYRSKPGHFWDLYVLNLNNSNQVFAGENGVLGGTNFTTLATRIVGDIENTWLYDAEGMLQVGNHSNQRLQAAASTTGVGYNFKDVDMAPQFWIYYDFASGDSQPGQGDRHGTFNQLYPFGHYYLGYLDLVARQNIQDFNMQFVFFPTKWIYFLAQYHNFHLAQARSPLFSAGGVPMRVDPTGAAGTDVGDEFDVLVNFHLTAHQDILVGFSKLFPGNFIRQTGPDVSPELFYLQHQLRW
jgi:hypothetical protein